MTTATDTRTVEQLVAASEVGSVIIRHAVGMGGRGLALRSPKARLALAWMSVQEPDVIEGIVALFRAAKDDEARSCTCLGSGT